MSEKTRRTVTTIESHEVWIIRKPAPEFSKVDVFAPDDNATDRVQDADQNAESERDDNEDHPTDGTAGV